MKIEDHDRGQEGELVFYAHGAESLRTYVGLSKMHNRPDCSALVRRRGTVVKDRIKDVLPRQRCKLCHPELADRSKPPVALW